ncbi:cryptochrome/photolyase family protein [Pseudohalioglobus lutimaris]|uniref:Cryptochrome/photolyase family protein n=1 Tax=Pseudohalioglobus lutimaris TaxID=1737061 RepID=A0A2N5X139_9GAMM|nr:cryptochrome/photolyase family protein [Pseudohalioglobus lutimaris]PLW68170.1 cryptochrome/photolyase family protein [Pseudohalioglobus lutimaris]
MNDTKIVLVLGDQLSHNLATLRDLNPATDSVVMAEVAAEANYVPHNRHKIALIFAAMRHFRDELRAAGVNVVYVEYGEGLTSLGEALNRACSEHPSASVACCEPGEYRVREHLDAWAEQSGRSFHWIEDDRFLCSIDAFKDWAHGRKQLRMEHFYRQMRRDHGLLLDASGGPEGDKWNYDQENRAGWRGKDTIPQRPVVEQDAITKAVLEEVEAAFPDNPGDLSQFNFAVTASGALMQLDYFIAQCLPLFGHYQDALAEESPWLFHSLISMYLNIGLLDPLDICQRVENAFREGCCGLSAAEGFIRQVLGWREYVRGIYWLNMPGYDTLNELAATTPLPTWFWTADTDMQCLHKALQQSLELGYAHHIQRLMIIGNFALLAGLDVQEVCDWYLAVYVDAFEWVELPNTLGMALHADGGLMASKPYAASGKYIKRQGNHCNSCRYTPEKLTGNDACPYNSLYWQFIDRHREKFEQNPRMRLTLANWQRKPADEQHAILNWAGQVENHLLATDAPL